MAFLVDAATVAQASPAWRAGARLALAIVGPLALGEIVNLGPIAVIPTLVALNVGIADEPEAFRVRFRLMATAAILYCGVVALATVVGADDLAVLVISVGLAGLAALAVTLGARGTKLGLLTALMWTIFAYGNLPEPEVGIRVAAAAGGAAWVLAVFLWPWPIQAVRPATCSVDAVWAALAALARRPADLGAIRVVRSRIDIATERLRHIASPPAILSGQIRAADALTTAISSVARLDALAPATETWLRSIGELQRSDRSMILAKADDALERAGGPPSIVALGRMAQRDLTDPVPIHPKNRQPWTVARLVDEVRSFFYPGATQWHHALRYAVAMAVAGTLALWGPFQDGYWVPLTVLIILAPTTNATLTKGLQRTAGTVIGVGIAIVIADLLPGGSIAHLAVLGFLAVMIGALMPLNYGIAVIFITCTVIILLSWPTGSVGSVAFARLVDTLVGASIALIVGVFVWPHHPRDDLRPEVADALGATARYADAALRPCSEPSRAPQARRVAAAALSTARATVAEAAADWSRTPPDAPVRLLDAIHDIGREILEMRARIRGATLVPDETTDAARRETVALLDRLAVAMSTGRTPSLDGPDFATWPLDLQPLGKTCKLANDLTVAAVAEPQR